MLIESIKMTNFRQFRDEAIDFASGDDGKNVTILIGDNGTGKTTIAQAFIWCMYGESDFSDRNMLNKTVASNLRPSQIESVSVELRLVHSGISYILTREQKYKKEYSGKVSIDYTTFDIGIRKDNGTIEYVPKTRCEEEVEKILPKELSRYFFFDGERIDKMSKDIASEHKSTDFAGAVKNLLGLNAMNSAIEHFNPRRKPSVISSYANDYDSSSNQKVQDYTNTITSCDDQIKQIENSLNILEENKKNYEIQKNKKSDELKEYSEGKELQDRKDGYEKDIVNAKTSKATSIKSACDAFNGGYNGGYIELNSFFSASLIKRSIDFLSGYNLTGRDVPYMNDQSIQWLLNRGECLCGACLDKGTEAFNKVQDWLEYLPPQSISSAIGDFKKEATMRAKALVDFPSKIQDSIADISRQNDVINDKQEEIDRIDKKLSGDDVSEKVRSINSEINQYVAKISNCDEEIINNKAAKKVAEEERRKADTQRRDLALLDDKNRRIEIYRAYAERVYEELKVEYDSSEKKVREELENTINDIFKKLYDGGLSLTIDEKYRISVSVNEYDGYVETSTAQSIAVIFAFITAIIKMAKDNSSADRGEDNILVSEPYPLVMDAPLSAFDKRRIKAVCETLPDITEQIIIFIKDTDGELAEKYMGDKIGKRYTLIKHDEFTTTIE